MADKGFWRVVVALPVELACAGEFKPELEVFGYCAVEQRALRVARFVEFGFGPRWHPCADASALALDIRRWAWGSASRDSVSDRAVFISSFVALGAKLGRRQHYHVTFSPQPASVPTLR